MMDIPEIKKL